MTNRNHNYPRHNDCPEVPNPSNSTFEARVAALETADNTLRARLTTLESHASPDFDAVIVRLTAIEEKVAAIVSDPSDPTSVAALKTKVDAMEARIAALEVSFEKAMFDLRALSKAT